jgi:nitroreductase
MAYGKMMIPPFDLQETDRLLSTTRAVRKRLDFERPVEREILLDCIRLSQQAPTGSNSQLWRWLVITNTEKRRAIGEIYARGAKYLSEAKKQVAQGDQQTARVYDSAEYLAEHISQVPALVIPCVVGRPSDDATLVENASIFGSILPAVWSFQLALRSRGLGSVWTTLHLVWEQEVAELLNVPNDVMQVAMLPVAYTIGTDFKIAQRQPPEEITYWDGWHE